MTADQTEVKTIFFDLGKVIVNYDTDLLVEGYNKYGKIDKKEYIVALMELGCVLKIMQESSFQKKANQKELKLGALSQEKQRKDSPE